MEINKNTINKILETIVIVHMYEKLNRATNSDVLQRLNLLEIAKQLEEEGMLVSGKTYNGKVLENTAYMSTPFGSDFLTLYGVLKGVLPEKKVSNQPAYHPV
jgi:hypothetical protein